jgi:uncharacterized protein with NRDE domain
MCLAVIAIDVLPQWPLIVVANRDEFHERPAATLQPWKPFPTLLAGQDLQAGGTWLGVTTAGRFSLLTNYRDPLQHGIHAPSRGQLVENYLKSKLPPVDYLRQIEPTANHYKGFNLLVADGQKLCYAGNQAQPFIQTLPPGIYGLSNALLNTPWPKTSRTTEAIAQLLAEPTGPDPRRLLAVLQDRTSVADRLLPDTGVGLERERLLGTPFIVSRDYGTRCTTIVMRHRNGSQWVQEDTYNASGQTIDWHGWLSSHGNEWRRFDAWPGSAKIASSAIA